MDKLFGFISSGGCRAVVFVAFKDYQLRASLQKKEFFFFSHHVWGFNAFGEA
jgi:hypothetical protein